MLSGVAHVGVAADLATQLLSGVAHVGVAATTWVACYCCPRVEWWHVAFGHSACRVAQSTVAQLKRPQSESVFRVTWSSILLSHTLLCMYVVACRAYTVSDVY
jgi:hypothetical protein